MTNAEALIQIWGGDTSITAFAEECGVDLDAAFPDSPATCTTTED
jgi:hypothetical protein